MHKDSFLHKNTLLNCKGKLLDVSTPKVMGILNVTPNSFYDGGHYQQIADAMRQAERMLNEGAAIIDIGGMSSKPGAEIISVKEELKRTIPVVEQLHRNFPDTIISIDTVRGTVASEAVAAGASVVNDISAGNIDHTMFSTIAQLKNIPYILMHMQGTPKTMQQQTNYTNVTHNIIDFFVEKLAALKKLMINDIVLDVGFGFGKSLMQNYTLLKHLPDLAIFEQPILVGVSRKSMIYKVLDCTPARALNGTTAAHVFALQNGANLLRVHDVQPAIEAIKIVQAYQAAPDK